MLKLFLTDPRDMSPTVRRLALLGVRVACWFAPVMLIGLLGAAVAHFLFEVGNYPNERARYTVGSLFLFLFVPVVGAIWYFARQRRTELEAADAAKDTKEETS